MALGSVVAKNMALDALYGTNHSTVAPATIYLGFYYGDPGGSGVELDDTVGGYGRSSITNNSTNFPDASAGQKTNGTVFTSPTSTGAWSNPASHWAFFDDPTAGNMLNCGPIETSGSPTTYTVTAAGDSIYFPIGSLAITAS